MLDFATFGLFIYLLFIFYSSVHNNAAEALPKTKMKEKLTQIRTALRCQIRGSPLLPANCAFDA